VTHAYLIPDTAMKAENAERLIPPPDPATTARRRFIGLLAVCFLVHAIFLALLLIEETVDISAPTEEIPVELVTEIPEPKVEPPPPKEQQKQPKQKMVEDEEIARDAPRDANKETIEREAPNKETQAQRVAPPTEQSAQTPAPPKPPEALPDADVKAPREDAPAKLADETPDAEPLDKAAPAPDKKPTEKKAPVESKAPSTKSKTTSVADQLAALSAVPQYRLGSAARPSPVGGGAAKTSYLSILYGLIMRQMHFPPGLEQSHLQAEGIVAFYVDDLGNLTHQAIYRASGSPALDSAAINAVRHAAPFPAPPNGEPHAIWFHYDTR
jgi:protein TonB